MIGRRRDVELHLMEPGDYGRGRDGTWLCRAPNGYGGNLSGHEVVEHDDGTITVSPSILICCARGEWNGWLRAGEWSDA